MDALTADDLALLRRFEPILAFNRGEQFYPMDVDRYLAGASLSVQRPDALPTLLVPRGQLDGQRMTTPDDEVPGAVYYLSVADPLTVAQVRAFRRGSTLREFHVGPGRLVRVGLLARFFDLLFSLSLYLRGTAPGGLAAGAAQRYQATQAEGERYCYYGRVLREHGYLALQYWFFYAFNDWRSSFHGVNDHEADWELVTVYVAEDQAGVPQPCWLACSEHDSEGDDLRRRWDDPALEREGEHPIVYAGAGSHANYFFPGEYMPAVPVPFTRGLAQVWLQVRRAWARLGQGDEPDARREGGGFRIPFVDYARGDGPRIGPAQQRTWEMRPLQATVSAPAPPWVEGYAGLWGLYSGDPRGENAPPGPRYEANGSERKRWYDPVGWSGLDKVPPPAATPATLEQQRRRLRDEHDELTRQIAEQAARLADLEMEGQALSGGPARRSPAVELQHQSQEAATRLERLKADRSANELAQTSCARYALRLAAGDPGDPRAHLRRPSLPSSPANLRLGKLAAIWSAISIGVLLLASVALFRFSGLLVPGALALITIYASIEALFHREMQRLIRFVVVGLAVFTTLLLLLQFFGPVLVALVALVGLFIIVENVRELFA